jgi:two-component system cell cycle sensor histidine kinase/response regulator CckA
MRTARNWPESESLPNCGPGVGGKLEVSRRQAQRMEAIGRMATGVAHEFNNLLTVIGGYSELLLTRGGPEHNMREELLKIQQASTRAAAFSRQLLLFSTQENFKPERVDLNELLADHAKILRPLIGENIELRTSPAPGVPAIEANPAQLLQILLILAANSRDAMPKGGSLTLSTGIGRGAAAVGSSTDQSSAHPGVAGGGGQDRSALPTAGAPPPTAGPEAMLRVTDTGCGMDENVKAHLFEPSFTAKEPDQGRGCGLATVAQIVGQMHGRIEVESEPGRGTSLAMFFPPAPKYQPAVAPTAAGRAYLKGTETILVVEDADHVRSLIERVLTMHGYTVLTASDGDQALAVAQQAGRPVDLLITDVVMPGMSGQQLAESLAKLQAGVRVLFVSGYSPNILEEAGSEKGPQWFLQKPFTPEALLRKIRDVLGPAT